MPRVLCVLEGVEVLQDEDNRIHFTADADIDADGANGVSLHPFSGKPLFAYTPRNDGLDDLRNAGYPDQSYQDVLVCNAHGKPIQMSATGRDEGSLPTLGYYSKTAYYRSEKDPLSPDRYLDSVSVPYIVIENFIRRRAKGIVLGCKARVSYLGLTVDAVVGDIGPLYKIGEISISAADALGIDSDPRTGGLNRREVLYELWPDVPSLLNGERFDLLPL